MHTATRDPRYPDARILSVIQSLMLQNLRTTKPLLLEQVRKYLTAGVPVVGVYHSGGFRVAVPAPQPVHEIPSMVVIKELLKDKGFIPTNRVRFYGTDLLKAYTWYAPVLNNRTAPYLGGIHD